LRRRNLRDPIGSEFVDQKLCNAKQKRIMKILRARHLGMCFGVRDAITAAKRAAESGPVTVLGQLVHNPVVLERMQAAGVDSVDRLEDVTTPRAMISAHGVSDRFRRRLEQSGLAVTDTTCPLVASAHRAVQQLVTDGFHPVIIGRRGHVEVRGLVEDLEQCDIVLSDADVDRLAGKDRFGVCAQTTQPIERVRDLVDRIRGRFPEAEVRFVDTVCRPTKDRQDSAEEIARQSDLVIVVGGNNSNNTAELSATCRRYCDRVRQVSGPEEVCDDWFASVKVAGLTAGTSTPDDVIDAVERRIREITARPEAALVDEFG
jgi:4-hydroxy-3-methylbut-2-enyl diphosphate reductase